MNIRYAAFKDIDAMVDLLTQLFSIEKDFVINRNAQRAGLELVLSDAARSVICVAETDGGIAGMVTGQLVVSTAAGGFSVLLEDMFVKPDYRSQGVGVALIRALTEWGGSKGARRIQLVADKTNEGALAFYRKADFDISRMVGLYKKIADN
jgi:ribosomal protein S18 acetylase RimI-like enzyme